MATDVPDLEGIGPSGLVWHNERRRIGDLEEWGKNPRNLTDGQADQIKQSIARFGFVDPVVINTDNRIVGGHMRKRVMLARGLVHQDTEIDVRVPSRLLTEDEFEELAIRLNKNTGSWDYDKLANQFDQVKLLDWGFTLREFHMEDHDPPPHAGGGGPGRQETITCPQCGATFNR